MELYKKTKRGPADFQLEPTDLTRIPVNTEGNVAGPVSLI